MSRPDVFENIAALLAALTTGQRLLGLDIGDKTIGLAISDPMFMIASPVKTIMRTEKFATAVAEMREIVKNEEVGGLLWGCLSAWTAPKGPDAKKHATSHPKYLCSLIYPSHSGMSGYQRLR